ncbi:helicase, partial [Klebsiella pneumoniae]|nr:helicase [Klebsiella pneumoniae]
RTSNMSSQVIRVLQRFALVATALALASRNYLVPWDEEESIDSVKQVWGQWLAARGHVMNSEEHQVLSRLKVLLPKWEKALQPLGHQNATSLLGYIRELDGERQWLIDKKQFLRQLDMPGQYMREVMPMLQRGWLATNEPERATLKLMIQGKSHRFFALWPERIYAGIQELELDD